MARRKAEAPLIPSNSLVASAVRYPGKTARIYQPNKDWQKECYRHFSICGEARFAATFFGKALSKATLSISKRTTDGPEPVLTGPAVDTLMGIFNGASGQAQMLEAIGIHLTIAGECYIVGRTVVTSEESGNPEDSSEVWEVLSPLEISVTGTKWQIDYGEGMKKVDLADDDVVVRVWTPSPARRVEADSPFRSLLPILNEIEWLTRHIFAQVTSRLTGAGILVLPQSVTFPKAPTGASDDEASSFMAVLGEAMMTPLDHPESPAAVIPIVIQVPDEVVDKITHLKFWTELDAQALALRSEAIRRFATGMDLPAEQILGMSSNGGTGGGSSNGVSHWGAWQIEESTIKMHIQPMLETISNAMTIGLIRPVATDVSEFVAYNTAELRLRPDRSKEALELYDRGMLKQSVTLKEVGFQDDDKPDPEELKEWYLRKIASGSATPEQVGEALKLLTGVNLPTPEGSQSVGNESRPDPSLDDHPSKPRTPDESAALYAACDALMFRAMERVGNRLRQQGCTPEAPAYETHCHLETQAQIPPLLVGAFSSAASVLDDITPNRTAVEKVLNLYATDLIKNRKPHTKDTMKKFLAVVL